MKNLFKLIATTATLLIIISCINTNNPNASSPQIINGTENSTNIIGQINEASIALVRDNGRTYCGGTWVAEHYILTARHCLEEMFVSDPSGSVVLFKTFKQINKRYPHEASEPKYSGTVHSVDNKSDVGLVYTPEKIPHKVAAIRDSKLFIGQGTHIIGHPSGLEFTYLPGVVSQIRYYNKTYVFSLFSVIEMRQKVIQMNSDIWFGNSGGGAFDNKGRLIGVCSFLQRARGMSFFIHKDMLVDYLKKEKVQYYLR